DGPAADLDHRLGAGLRLLGQTGPQATGQDHHLHRNSTRPRPPARAGGGATPPWGEKFQIIQVGPSEVSRLPPRRTSDVIPATVKHSVRAEAATPPRQADRD